MSGAADEDFSALELERLAAIVSSSADAIVSKTLEGRVTSWNGSAERILGWTAAEMIGQPIETIIPDDLLAEEKEILRQIRAGERVEPFDTERLTRDGRRVPLSITVSPLRNRAGEIVGASKVARDISERRQHEEVQRLLIDELNHRVKNTLAVVQSIARQSLRSTHDPAAFVAAFSGRIDALTRAYDRLVEAQMKGTDIAALVADQVVLDSQRISWAGPPVSLVPTLAVKLALVLHELATNARKHGSLSVAEGVLDIRWEVQDRNLSLRWKESGPQDLSPPGRQGLGMRLIHETFGSIGGETRLRFEPDGVACEIRIPI
ncbi:sensor histidine kinase [Halodurantibacterium flavum]|uniref:histidine kinase n=1 Tax=Halodurantibacterium flavum TaxID=1382802 RepID=A0ABW4SAF9_9RHOB